MEAPTYPTLDPSFEEYLTRRLQEYANAEARTRASTSSQASDSPPSMDDFSSLSPLSPLSPSSTSSCPVSPSPTRHRLGYRPQKPTYNATRGILKSITEGNNRRLSKLLGRRMGSTGQDDLAGPLMQAIRTGQQICVASLLNAGADPNCVDDEGKTPLFILMENGGGNPEIMRTLLKAGASPNKVSWTLQQTPLHLASRKGYQVCVKGLLASNGKPDRRDSAGNTPCMFASKDGHVNIVRMLLRHGAGPNVQNLTNETPVHFAAKGGHADCLYELLEARASPNDRDSRGQTPLMIACKLRHQKLVELLLDYECDVNGQDTNTGKTALHWAVQNGDVNVVTELLDAGADTNIKDKNWATPFMLALRSGRRDILELLLHAGCNVIITDRSYNTALHLAASDGQKDLIPFLVEAGINVDIKGAGGSTPLMLGAYGGFYPVVEQLLQFGASPDLMDRNRATALMYAILSQANDSDVHTTIKFLIRSNCDLNHCANLGKVLRYLDITLSSDIHIDDRLYSPMEVAYLRGRTAIFMMLIKAGCDITTFSGDQIFHETDSKNQDTEQQNRWYLLRCLQKEREQVKPLKELCRKPMLQFLSKKHVKGALSIHMKIDRLPFSDNLKSFLNYDDIDEVEAMYNVTLREKSKRSPIKTQPGADIVDDRSRNGLSPNGNGNSSARTSVRLSNSSGFNRNSLSRQSLPVGYYHSTGPLSSSTSRSTPVKSPNRVNATDLESGQTPATLREPSGKRPTRHSANMNTLPRSLPSAKTRTNSRNNITEVNYRTLPTRASMREKTNSSNSLATDKIRMYEDSPRHAAQAAYGRVIRKKTARETEYEKMESAYDSLRNSMIAQGSLSDMTSSSSSLAGSRQRLNKQRGRYSQIDTTAMLASRQPTETIVSNGMDTSLDNGSSKLSEHTQYEHMDIGSPNDSRSSSDEVFHTPTSSSKYRNMYDQMKMGNSQRTSNVPHKAKSNLPSSPDDTNNDVHVLDEWNLRSLRAPRLFKPRNATQQDHRKEELAIDEHVIDDIIKKTEEELKHPKVRTLGEERPLSPMADETYKALFATHNQRPSSTLNDSTSGKAGGTQSQSGGSRKVESHFSVNKSCPSRSRLSYQGEHYSDEPKNDPADPSSSITMHGMSTVGERKRLSLNLGDPNGQISSLKSQTSPTSPSMKEVRFTTGMFPTVKTSPCHDENTPEDEGDPSLKRWGTMTLDDPEILDNSENFTCSSSLKSPTSRRDTNSGRTRGGDTLPSRGSLYSPKQPMSPRHSINTDTASKVVTSPVKEHTNDTKTRPRSAFSTPNPKRDHHQALNIARNLEPLQNKNIGERLSQRRPISPVDRNNTHFSSLAHRPFSPTGQQDASVPFSRGARPYSSVRVQSSSGQRHRHFSPPPSGTQPNARKRLGFRSREQTSTNDESPLVSPAEKKELLFNGREESSPGVTVSDKPGSKIKMAFLRSRSFRR